MDAKPILLVEDNLQDELLTLRALKQNKITNEVIIARDGAEAVDYLFCTGKYSERNPDITPQVVLLDINLPKMDGLQVLERIRASQITKRLPVVLLTTSKEEKDVATGYNLGANSYVRKPVDFSHFTETVKSLGEYWLKLNEVPPR
ncbi:MAG: response regulator [Bdellovibrionales bacterium]|nr:response regulator [Bdellovibrionales bacterium]